MKKPARNLRWIISGLLTLTTALFLGAAVYYWFYRGHTWMLGPVKVRLHQWRKPWLIATALWTLAVFIRPGPFIPAKALLKFFHPWPGSGTEARDRSRAWMILGAALGGATGFYLADIYSYLFPDVFRSLLVVVPAVILGSAAHWAWGKGVGRPAGKFMSQAGPQYLSGIRTGLYISLWLLLVYGPLQRWEGRFYDRLWPLAAGFFTVVGLAWVYAALCRVPSLHRRRGVVFISGALVSLAAIGAISSIRYYRSLHPAARPRTRVIFITLDTVRADHLSCYGYPRLTSPRIDAIAQQGARFSLAICPMSLTDPSHASMFTGLYPWSHGVTDILVPLAVEPPSLPEYFKDRGFGTAAIVSRFKLSPAHSLLLPGFDYESVPGRGGQEASAPATFRRAASWLTRRRDENVFMWVHFFDAHSPYLPHQGSVARFTDASEECVAEPWLKPDESYSEDKVKRCVGLYDGEIAYVDYWVGRLVSWVEDLEPKSEEPPLIVLTADHGETLGEYQSHPLHYGFGHGGLLYNSENHIPLILYWPGHVPAGRVDNSVAETVDLAPTLVDYVFDKHDFKGQGQSLRPLIEGTGQGDDIGFIQRWRTDEDPPRPQMSRPAYAVVQAGTKLIVEEGKPAELYDLSADPKEERNLLDQRPDQAQALTREFGRWMERTPEVQPSRRNLNGKERDALKALGYIQ